MGRLRNAWAALFPPPPTPGPIGEGSVRTPDVRLPPVGYLWDQLHAATSLNELEALRRHAKAHGYSPTGQFMTALTKQIKQLGGTV